MKLEVGEFYLTEDGRIVKIIEKWQGAYNDIDDFIYDENGINDGEKTQRNLIAHIPKELHKMICELVNNYHSNNEAIKELEELENRSCSNCKYLCNITKECEQIDCPCFGLIINIEELCDFYCNKWENKQ